MAFKGTYGPHHLGEAKNGRTYIYANSQDQPLKPNVVLPKKHTPEMRANAQLFATAYELLGALKAVQALLPEDVQHKLGTLIAKAEGR